MAWSTKMTERVNAISEVEVRLWHSVFSPGAGTLSWTCVVENLAQLENLEQKLLADDGYLSLVEEGAKYSSGEAINDSLVRYVHIDREMAQGQPQYASVVGAVLAPASSVTGIELGVEIAATGQGDHRAPDLVRVGGDRNVRQRRVDRAVRLGRAGAAGGRGPRRGR